MTDIGNNYTPEQHSLYSSRKGSTRELYLAISFVLITGIPTILDLFLIYCLGYTQSSPHTFVTNIADWAILTTFLLPIALGYLVYHLIIAFGNGTPAQNRTSGAILGFAVTLPVTFFVIGFTMLLAALGYSEIP